MDYKKMNIDDIINWCVANNQVEWLKAEAAKKEKTLRYTGRIEVIREDGKKVYRADKNSPQVEKEAPISFITLKKNFATKFMPEILPEATEKEPSMFDKIAAL